MKIAIVIALSCMSAVQSAAINTTTSDASTINGINFESAEFIVTSEVSVTPEQLPQWFIEFNDYIDSEEETDFDVISFINKLEANETEDFLDLLMLMIDQEFSVDKDTNVL